MRDRQRHIWRLELPGGLLSNEHKIRIRDLFHGWYLDQLPRDEHSNRLIHPSDVPPAFLEVTGVHDYPMHTIPWHIIGDQWTVVRGEIAGTLPKRLSTWFNGRLPKLLAGSDWPCPKVPKELFARLGAELGPAVNSGTVYHVEIRHRIDWDAGEFGDLKSCYWTSHAHSKPSLAATGKLFALCFYRDDGGEPGDGFARCWGLRLGAGEYVLSNAYGLPMITIARLLSMVLGLRYSDVDLVLDNVYVNDGSQLLSESTSPRERVHVNVPFEADEDCSCDECHVCSACGYSGCTMCNECENQQCECSCCAECHQAECRCCSDCGMRECECPICALCQRTVPQCAEIPTYFGALHGINNGGTWFCDADASVCSCRGLVTCPLSNPAVRTSYAELCEDCTPFECFAEIAAGILQLMSARVGRSIEWHAGTWTLSRAVQFSLPMRGVTDVIAC